MSKKKKEFILGVIILIIAAITGIFNDNQHAERKITSPDVTTITFLDVGQGDSTLIELENGKVMLIDSGEYEYAGKVTDALSDKGISKIDYLVATHPHSDHIGSMAQIINNFDIGTFYMPDVSHNSKSFEKMLEALNRKKVRSEIAKAGKIIFDDGFFKAEILSPVSDYYEDLNNYSAVVRLECGEKSFMFMGDAEKYAENLITGNVSCDVIKLGHHGSTTSSGKDFFKKANPKYAVISCGANNDYGHPHDEIIDMLEYEGINYYRTDTAGDIVIICDGENINVIENN